MNPKGRITVLFFGFLTIFTLTDCNTCKTNRLEGKSVTFKLTDSLGMDVDRLIVRKDDKIVVRGLNVESPWMMDLKNDVLELQHVKLSDSGTYNVESYDKSGSKLISYSDTVCVYAQVPKPAVNVTCQNEKVDLRCDVEDDKDLSFIWHKNGNDMKTGSKVLTVNVDNSKYTCTAKNPVHESTSDAVEAACSNPNTLFGFDFWIMVSILAGGGGLVLLLVIVLVTVACRSCKRREKRLRDEEELRLNYLNCGTAPGYQKSKQTARGQPAPPEPYDNVSAQEVPCQTEPKPRTQQRARPPPPPIEDDEEQPPPLPQPRKKVKNFEPL